MANLGAQAESGLDASDITTGTLGNTVFPAGHVIKTYSVVFKGTQAIQRASTPGTRLNDSEWILVGTGASGASGEALSIVCDAPRSSSSKYLITGHVYFSNDNGGGTYFVFMYSNSGQTVTKIPDTNGTLTTNQQAMHLGYGHQSSNTFNYAVNSASMTYLWSPSSSLAQTISLRGCSYNTSRFDINLTSDNSDSAYNSRGISTLTVQEIAG